MSISALKEKFNSLTLESENHWDYRGNNNSERDYVHGFCTYPAMMVPKMQREMLDVCLEHLQDTSIRLLDPFAGSGTILVEGMLRGLNIVGIDINPLAILLCKAKTTILNPTTLHEKTVQLFAWITIHDKTPLYKFDGINKWFTNQAISDLSRIRAGIIAEETIEYRRFFWASFCEVVRIVSNSRDCTYKLHIKEKKDIDAYAVDAVDLFKTTLQYNIAKYNEFYSELQKRGHLKKNGSAYKGQVKIVLSDSIAYLNHSKQKYSLVFTSPPYGDNHTTVSYGQYSIMPLRWINYHDIDEAVDETLLATLYEIDNQSLGGKSSNKALTPARKKVVKKSETLKIQLNQINNLASQQSNKIIAFYSDYDRFLAALSRKMKSNAISVWTLGNRKVAKQEIFMDKIMIELCKPYYMQLLTNFTRQILNKLFANKASVRGESYIEVAARLVQIFHQDEYNKAIAGQHSLIAEKAHYYEKLCAAITETVGNEQALTSTLKEYRDIELYNKHINAQHCEIATGDIFKIGSSYFLLVSQACDTCLRSDGHRKLEFASLLEIQDNKQTKFSYPLSCFLDMQKPVVMYHALKIIPFDILDLCVFNGSGQASVVLNDIASYDRDLEAYTNNYRIRFGEVLETVKAVQSNRAKLESFLSGGADITAEDAKAAYEYLEGVDSNMKKFDSIEIAISFPVRRIARLNELTTIDIVKEYGIALSRIGHPFDFSGEISAFE